MSWPLSQDYNEAVQYPAENFADPALRRGEATTNALGIPLPRSGNFADVYEVRCPDGARWAVKCFTRKAAHLREPLPGDQPPPPPGPAALHRRFQLSRRRDFRRRPVAPRPQDAVGRGFDA